MPEITVTREHLYEEVWIEPMRDDFYANELMDQDMFERASRIFSTVAYAGERNGWKVGLDTKRNYPRGVLVIEDQPLTFSIKSATKYFKNGTGNQQQRVAVFEFEAWRTEFRTRWRDGLQQTLEELIPAILSTAVPIAAVEKVKRLAEEEEEEAEKRERKHRAEAATDQMAVLEADMKGWEYAQRLRAFCQAVNSEEHPQESSPDLEKWTEWAQSIANDYDPFVRRKDGFLARYFRADQKLWRLIPKEQ